MGMAHKGAVLLKDVSIGLELSFTGSVLCRGEQQTFDMGFSEPRVTSLKMDDELKLDSSLDDIINTMCVDSSRCTKAVKRAMTRRAHNAIVKATPETLRDELTPLLNRIASNLRCPFTSEL